MLAAGLASSADTSVLGRNSPCWRGLRSAWLDCHGFLRAAPERAGHRRRAAMAGVRQRRAWQRRRRSCRTWHCGEVCEHSARCSSVVDAKCARPDSPAPEKAQVPARRTTQRRGASPNKPAPKTTPPHLHGIPSPVIVASAQHRRRYGTRRLLTLQCTARTQSPMCCHGTLQLVVCLPALRCMHRVGASMQRATCNLQHHS